MRSKLKLLFIFLFFAFGPFYLHANHPIYILLTHPRATATAFERVMRTKENLQVLHAPYLDSYLIKKYGTNHILTKSLKGPHLTFDDVTNHLFEMSKTAPVFFKESGYLLVDYLKEHPELLTHEQIKIAFLVRDPAKSIISYYRKMPTVDDSIIGHRQLWELFNLILDQKNEIPLVIDSDEFLKSPLKILNRLGIDWGLTFDQTNLSWESGYSEDWHVRDWYVEVAESTELGDYTGDVERDENGTPLYLEVTTEPDRQRLRDIFQSQNIYYQQLFPYALKAKE